MRLGYFDCPSGAAGDMILGAVVDAGVPFERLRAELDKLGLAGYALECREVVKSGFRATKVDVRVDGESSHSHSDAAAEGDRSDARHGHPERNLRRILELIERSKLAPSAKARAGRVFTRLAEAEARAHGTTVEAVHFHDVGAVDAIVDVVGACVGLDLLGIDRVHCSPLPMGGGFARGPHGRIPVPGPATAELLKGFPVVDTGVRRELVTPTGAAILTTLAASTGTMPAMTVTAVGCGAGTIELDTPNLIRLFVGEAADALPLETIVQVETTVDDMSPQLYETLMERLFEAGALDVYLTPVVMKKSRPGVVVTALCAPERVGDLSRALFEESTTIGVRWSEWRRARLQREMVEVTTAYGAIPFKVSRLDGRIVTITPEFVDVARIAREKSLPVREVLDQARADGRRLLG
jgi:pyridinium-3,5-bisthiocarboxylic acid mononucleotide nickel chelatase